MLLPTLRIIPGWQQGNPFEGANQTTLVNILIVSPTSVHYVGGWNGRGNSKCIGGFVSTSLILIQDVIHHMDGHWGSSYKG